MPTDRLEETKMPQAYYRKLLKGFAEAVEPTPMQESWIENIIEVRYRFCELQLFNIIHKILHFILCN